MDENLSEKACPQPVIFVGHGGGPGFFMSEKADVRLKFAGKESSVVAKLKGLFHELFGEGKPYAKPKAILVVSAHWEAQDSNGTGREFQVLDHTKTKPYLLFDYYGFPKETYDIKYECPTDAGIIARVKSLLNDDAKRFTCTSFSERGLDHGVFIPLSLMYEPADIPVIQVSLASSLDAGIHFDLGKKLSQLRDEGVLIFCSGMATHNLGTFRENHGIQGSETDGVEWAQNFQSWLDDHVILAPDQDQRSRISKWKAAPDALKSHPREEHLLPLFVAVGASLGDRAEKLYDGYMARTFSMASYVWHPSSL